jgi:hypothetical protein
MGDEDGTPTFSPTGLSQATPRPAVAGTQAHKSQPVGDRCQSSDPEPPPRRSWLQTRSPATHQQVGANTPPLAVTGTSSPAEIDQCHRSEHVQDRGKRLQQGHLRSGPPDESGTMPRSDAELGIGICGRQNIGHRRRPKVLQRAVLHAGCFGSKAGADMRGADGEHAAAPNGAEPLQTVPIHSQRCMLTCTPSHSRRSADRSVHVHTEEVTGSIPVSPHKSRGRLRTRAASTARSGHDSRGRPTWRRSAATS